MAEKSASAEEAVAVAAAIARFEADLGAAPDGGGAPASPWRRAALLEGVGAKETARDLEGGPRWQS